MRPKLADHIALNAANLLYRRPFLKSAQDPRRAQDLALRRILRENAGAEFGRTYGFQRLSTRNEYRTAVPVQRYDTLADAIRCQAETGAPTLTAESPVFYARTSGTTAPARDFPITARAQTAQRAAQRIFAATLYCCTGFFDGRIAGFGGAYVEGRLPTGQPYGSASGQTYSTAPGFVRRKFVVPEAAFSIDRMDEKYRAYALAILTAEDLTGIITANPTTLLAVLTHIRRDAEAILRDLRDAGRSDRSKQLERVLATDAQFGALWPQLNTLATWTGGNCRVALDQFLPLFSGDLRVVEIGYRASEFVGTINVDADANACLPDFTHSVFEFVEEEAWEQGGTDFLWLDEIEPGRRYYVFATTASGLYRYHINDVIDVTGKIGRCPVLAFVRKGQGVTSITGEKVYETQAIMAARRAARVANLSNGYFVVVADPQSMIYRLFYEVEAMPAPEVISQVAAVFDGALSENNIEYAAKRHSGRLSAAEVIFLRPGAGDAAKSAAITAGQREAQLKLPALFDAARWAFDIQSYQWDTRG